MDYLNLIFGLLLIILGGLIAYYYNNYIPVKAKGRLSFKILSGAFGLMIGGLVLVLQELGII